MVDMDTAKKLGTVGLRFTAPTGAEGVILPERSAHGKLQAEFSCIKGCGRTHIREQSDWHQCGTCRTCKPSKGGAGKSVKVELPDTPEVRALKEELATLQAEEAAAKAAEAAKAQLEAQLAALKAKVEELRAKKGLAQAA